MPGGLYLKVLSALDTMMLDKTGTLTLGTLAVDCVGVGLATFGLLNPVLAALIHVTSELLFILNSARLLTGSVDRDVPRTTA